MSVYIEDFKGHHSYANYTHFLVGDEAAKYVLTVYGYTGVAGKICHFLLIDFGKGIKSNLLITAFLYCRFFMFVVDQCSSISWMSSNYSIKKSTNLISYIHTQTTAWAPRIYIST